MIRIVTIRTLFLYILLFFQFSCFAQEFTFHLADSLTNSPIEYAHVLTKYEGTHSSETGQVLLKKTIEKDAEIQISAIGYYERTISNNQINSKDTILLIPRQYQLPEVLVVDGYKIKHRTLGNIDTSIRFTDGRWPGQIKGIFVERPKGKIITIDSVAIYLMNKNEVKPKSRLWITQGIPEGRNIKNIMNKDLYIKLPEGITEQYITIDLSQYELTFPKNGLSVFMEWLPTGRENECFTDNGEYIERFNNCLGKTRFKHKYNKTIKTMVFRNFLDPNIVMQKKNRTYQAKAYNSNKTGTFHDITVPAIKVYTTIYN